MNRRNRKEERNLRPKQLATLETTNFNHDRSITTRYTTALFSDLQNLVTLFTQKLLYDFIFNFQFLLRSCFNITFPVKGRVKQTVNNLPLCHTDDNAERQERWLWGTGPRPRCRRHCRSLGWQTSRIPLKEPLISPPGFAPPQSSLAVRCDLDCADNGLGSASNTLCRPPRVIDRLRGRLPVMAAFLS